MELRENAKNKYFFDPPGVVAKDANEEKAIQASKAENQAIWDRSGYRGIVPRLLKLGYFSNSTDTAIIAVRKTSFKEAIRILSIENSI